MSRRYWPAALAFLAIIVVGGYLTFNHYLEREIRRQSAIHSQMYEAVQRGLASETDDGQLQALFDMQEYLGSLNVPLIVYAPNGQLYAVKNLPFEPDLTDSADLYRVAVYAAELARRNPPIVSEHGTLSSIGTIYYGAPPLLRWLRWVPWLQASAGLILVIVAFTIIQANMRAERERLWAAMARELAHQMGTPLSSLAGWIEVLQMPAAERAALVEESHIAEVAGADVERLERVSRRFELIGKPPALQEVQVAEVLHELEAYFRPRLPRLSGGITMKLRVPDALPVILANPVLLVWALENIVKNGVDALAGRGGTILISAASVPERNGVRIRIADNGPGIAPEVRDRIFDAGVTTKSSGWGVGLALTRRIIEGLHGGLVTARSRRRGGAVFDVQLPIAGKRLRRRRFFRSR